MFGKLKEGHELGSRNIGIWESEVANINTTFAHWIPWWLIEVPEGIAIQEKGNTDVVFQLETQCYKQQEAILVILSRRKCIERCGR